MTEFFIEVTPDKIMKINHACLHFRSSATLCLLRKPSALSLRKILPGEIKRDALCVNLDANSRMLVNGAAFRTAQPVKVELMNRVNFLAGRQIMDAAAATYPAQEIYLAIQTAYVGDDTEGPLGRDAAKQLIDIFKRSSRSDFSRCVMDQVSQAFERSDFFWALKALRPLIDAEAEKAANTTKLRLSSS